MSAPALSSHPEQRFACSEPSSRDSDQLAFSAAMHTISQCAGERRFIRAE
jgi:hypothetical protein